MLAPLRTPRALHFARADLNPPSRARVLWRLRAGPERLGGRRRENAGGRRSRIDEGGTRSVALARMPQRRRENPA